MGTGLRVNGETDGLSRASVDLSAGRTSGTVQASYAKSRPEDTLPLLSDPADACGPVWRKSRPRLRRSIFRKGPQLNDVADSVRTDLADARQV